ncbi:hypothetical protein FOQG_11935 [Fusarium oxysporum f. sp. raphani 54005]|uniref:Uncharacterized protein n=2 Tax=Fusarium oxysporum TaxID=5507 RepID=X0BZ39_FUSOX|nr:hypothetical protein FOQG_11935 [Fusarium oxysporum f. sp. raphani 54005]EXL71634.1 hypothetical protein FOPG_12686 [Fusarium oxysporum f. sp. conglutinans race 2 54008]
MMPCLRYAYIFCKARGTGWDINRCKDSKLSLTLVGPRVQAFGHRGLPLPNYGVEPPQLACLANGPIISHVYGFTTALVMLRRILRSNKGSPHGVILRSDFQGQHPMGSIIILGMARQGLKSLN